MGERGVKVAQGNLVHEMRREKDEKENNAFQLDGETKKIFSSEGDLQFDYSLWEAYDDSSRKIKLLVIMIKWNENSIGFVAETFFGKIHKLLFWGFNGINETV